jgi:hypothetical protein
MASEINDCADVQRCVREYESSETRDPAERRYIIRRAIELGCTENIPDKWEVDLQNG